MIIIYDLNMKKKAILENVIDAGYEQKHNELWTAHFSLPMNDPKNEECLPLRYVEIYDENERVELFRITPFTLEKEASGIITYQCEHVLVTLIDDVLFQYHEIGGTGVFTTDVIEYILNQQTNVRWQLGTIEFNRQFLYSWENENLLSSLFSVAKPFLEDYVWTFDTTVYPFKINLVSVSDRVKSYVRYTKNQIGIIKETDPTELCTRLYCLGYGEGVNQLNIKGINNNLPYIDAPTISKYGIVSKVFVDRRLESEERLKATGEAVLNELQEPRITYTVNGVDLHQLTNDPVDKFQVSTFTRVIDTELNENVKSMILRKSKPNFISEPWNVQIEIANKSKDIASSISDLADRTRINEVYSQGATNLDSHDFTDNCDPSNPATIRFYIPGETIRINKMSLNYQSSSFRAFSKAIEGGGGVSTTTESGGGSSQTSSSGGSLSTTTESGGATITTSDNTQISSGSVQTADDETNIGKHNHGITPGTLLATSGGGYVTWTPSGAHNHGSHSHNITLSSHRHNIYIPSHQHSVQIPSHSHNITIPNHTHNIEYGIFNGPSPTSVTVRVDGNLISGLGTNESEVNIIPYLSKDSGGKVTRGWHEITITPNDLGRIEASVISQFFVQSRGGGDY